MGAPSSRGIDTLTAGKLTDQQPHVAIGSILEGISDAVVTVDRELRITAYNQAAEQITGISRAKAMGQSCATIFRSSLCGATCLMRETLETNTPALNRSASLINSAGQYIPVKVSTTPVRNKDNEVIGGVATFQDLRGVMAPARESTPHDLFAALITRNQLMGKNLHLLPHFAASQRNILIEGEQGTGKEMMARTIHAFRSRKQEPFIVVNCRALADKTSAPERLNDAASVLTGPPYHTLSEGITFPAGSTLFLRELNAANQALQDSLLRFLPEMPPHDHHRITARQGDVRVIASTTENLFTLVINGSFNRGLYARVNDLKMALPPLRNRQEDIPLLTAAFIVDGNRTENKSVTGVGQEAMSLLINYDFPGNISELKSIIAHAFVFCERGDITSAHLPEVLRIKQPAPIDPYSMELVVETAEAQAIIAALRRNKYHRQDAARELGIHKSTFFRKIKSLGIILPQRDGRFRDNGNRAHSW